MRGQSNGAGGEEVPHGRLHVPLARAVRAGRQEDLAAADPHKLSKRPEAAEMQVLDHQAPPVPHEAPFQGSHQRVEHNLRLSRLAALVPDWPVWRGHAGGEERRVLLEEQHLQKHGHSRGPEQPAVAHRRHLPRLRRQQRDGRHAPAAVRGEEESCGYGVEEASAAEGAAEVRLACREARQELAGVHKGQVTAVSTALSP
mmetsp:Transcript_24660/g.78080  ORF Transcript_24660/g.78080 Transcript_24660/m.78080 type:complete len:200 (+) Transcript_24660:598-1197(+)